MNFEDYPKTLYKYRSWQNMYHQTILKENQLYLASPKDFNDPMDCRIATNYFLLDTDEKKQEYVNQFVKNHTGSLIARGLNPTTEKGKLFERLKTKLEAVQKQQETETYRLQDIYYGVLSLSQRYDSILMWSHYADLHKGFCVGLNEKKLRESNQFGSGGRVTYRDKFPMIDPRNESTMEKAFLQTHSKANDWSYEKEFRLTKLFPKVPSGSDRLVTFTNDFIDEVIIGLNTPERHKEEIVRICAKKKIPIFQIEQIPFEFKLVKKPL